MLQGWHCRAAKMERYRVAAGFRDRAVAGKEFAGEAGNTMTTL